MLDVRRDQLAPPPCPQSELQVEFTSGYGKVSLEVNTKLGYPITARVFLDGSFLKEVIALVFVLNEVLPLTAARLPLRAKIRSFDHFAEQDVRDLFGGGVLLWWVCLGLFLPPFEIPVEITILRYDQAPRMLYQQDDRGSVVPNAIEPSLSMDNAGEQFTLPKRRAFGGWRVNDASLRQSLLRFNLELRPYYGLFQHARNLADSRFGRGMGGLPRVEFEDVPDRLAQFRECLLRQTIDQVVADISLPRGLE